MENYNVYQGIADLASTLNLLLLATYLLRTSSRAIISRRENLCWALLLLASAAVGLGATAFRFYTMHG